MFSAIYHLSGICIGFAFSDLVIQVLSVDGVAVKCERW